MHICADGCEKVSEDEGAVCGMDTGRRRQQSFRVPLKSCDRKKFVLDAFDCSIGRKLYNADIFAREADTLMMRTVYKKVFAIDMGKERVRHSMREMKLVTLFITVCVSLRQMLAEPSSEKNVYQLHALAYPEDGSAQMYKAFQQHKLLSVERGVDLLTGRMSFLGKGGQCFIVWQKGGIYISASGEEESVPVFGGVSV